MTTKKAVEAKRERTIDFDLIMDDMFNDIRVSPSSDKVPGIDKPQREK